MRLKTAPAVLLCMRSALAAVSALKYPSARGINTWSDSSFTVKTYDVIVGFADQLLFVPPQVNAEIGDRVNFRFQGSNHSVSQSSLDHPCMESQDGFRSGFLFNPTENDDFVTTITIVDPYPKYFFRNQMFPTSHCRRGMVFAINAGDTIGRFFDNVDAAASAAQQATCMPPFRNQSTNHTSNSFTTYTFPLASSQTAPADDSLASSTVLTEPAIFTSSAGSLLQPSSSLIYFGGPIVSGQSASLLASVDSMAASLLSSTTSSSTAPVTSTTLSVTPSTSASPTSTFSTVSTISTTDSVSFTTTSAVTATTIVVSPTGPASGSSATTSTITTGDPVSLGQFIPSSFPNSARSPNPLTPESALLLPQATTAPDQSSASTTMYCSNTTTSSDQTGIAANANGFNSVIRISTTAAVAAATAASSRTSTVSTTSTSAATFAPLSDLFPGSGVAPLGWTTWLPYACITVVSLVALL